MEDHNTELYRVISLESFLSLLYYQAERYVRPIGFWEDTYEGYMLHYLDSEEGEKKLLRTLYNDIVNHREHDAIKNYVKLLHARYLCYGQCWSTEPDSDAIWRIYSYGNKSIQLVTTYDRILRTITSESDWNGKEPRIEMVQYDSKEVPIEESVSKYFTSGMPVDEPYFHKRYAFQHEHEVRVILNDVKRYYTIMSAWCMMLDSNYDIANAELPGTAFEDKAIYAINKLKRSDHTVLHLNKAPKELFVRIDGLNRYIIGIHVHPKAESWYVDLIHKICDQHCICFLGQSELYNKPP